MKKSDKTKNAILPNNVPVTLEDHPFYGFTLNKEQEQLRDSMWNPDKKIIFCNAKAGTGKSFVSVATASLLVKYGLYERIVFVVAPTQEEKQGFLPGTIESKTQPYMQPLYDAVCKIGGNPMTDINQNGIMNSKMGTGYIDCLPHTFMRGINFENAVILIDESQNFYLDELKKVLTRVHDSCNVVVSGHSGQIDLYKNPHKSGFVRYIEHFTDEPYCEVVELVENFRGAISRKADELE